MSFADALGAFLLLSSMGAIGLRLAPNDVRGVAPRAHVLGLGFNVVVLPLVALAVLVAVNAFAPIPVAAAIGIALCAAAPGGATGLLLSRNANGDAALAVSVVLIGSACALVLVPLLVGAVGDATVTVSAGAVTMTLVLWQLLPLAVAMAIRARLPRIAERMATWLERAANVALVMLVVGLLVTEGERIVANGVGALAASVVLVVVSLALPLVFPLPRAARSALSMTSAVRNLSLALVVAAQHFTPATTLSVLVYGACMYVLAAPVMALLRRGTEVKAAVPSLADR